MPTPRLSADHIAAAARTIDPAFRDSPQFAPPALAEAVGVGTRVVCKVETLNPIRSFKGRGADHYVATLEGDDAPLVCASAGNFGQGLAWAGRARGRAVTVFAAESANPLKLERMRRLGAEVRLAGRDFDAAKDAGRAYAARTGARWVEDGREPAIAEGAGTIAVELCAWPEPLDVLLVPLGNGALAAGVGTWVRAHAPHTRVVAVCAAAAPSMARSLAEGRVVTTERADTVADGIAVRVPIPEALDDLRPVLDDVLLVDEARLLDAVRALAHHAGVVVEPAGAAGVAALLAHGERFRGATVGTILCGANVTPEQLAAWL
jgi:threonine dehydratase